MVYLIAWPKGWEDGRLVASAYAGELEVVEFLLDRGADVNLTGEKYGTALGAAAASNYCNDQMATALDVAANLTEDECAAARDAIDGSWLNIVKLLLDRGADVNLTGGEYGTALGAAAFAGKVDIVKLLLARGADVNHTGWKYGPAVGAAAHGRQLETAKLLLDQGANFNLSNSEGAKPRDLAEQHGYQEIMDFLDSRCVDTKPNASTDNACHVGSGANSSLHRSL